MKRVSLYHLETVLWISRLGTFAAAAERLNTTQPAISARVRELENQIGYALFQRAGRNMALTVRARQLVKEWEPLWASIERTLLQDSELSGASGTVRISAGEIAAATCLPLFLAQLKADFPRAILEVEIDLSHSMLQKLLAASSDLILLAGPVTSPTIETQPIGEASLVWVASPATAARVARDEAGQPLWLLHRYSPIHAIAVSKLDPRVFPESAMNSCNNVQTMIDIILADGGIGFLPELMVQEHVARGSLVRLWPERSHAITFQAAIRSQERDPLVRAIYDRAKLLTID